MTATLPETDLPKTSTRPDLDASKLIDGPQIANIFDKAIALALEAGKFGSSKKLGSDKIEVDADKDRVAASKRILASKELAAIGAAQAALFSRIKQISLPSLFKSGVFLVPISMVAEIDGILEEAQKEIMGVLVPAFLAAYPALVEADKISLRSNWNPADYPSVSKVKEAFYVEWSYINMGTPKELQGVDSSLFAREQEKAAQKMAEVTDQITAVLRGQMLDLVSHLSDKLTGGRGNGKPKVFKDTTVNNIKDFLATFKARNIVDDRQLDLLVAQAGQLLDGVDPQSLRSQETVRERVRQGFEEIKQKLDTMVVPKPTRMVLFNDPGAGEEMPELSTPNANPDLDAEPVRISPFDSDDIPF